MTWKLVIRYGIYCLVGVGIISCSSEDGKQTEPEKIMHDTPQGTNSFTLKLAVKGKGFFVLSKGQDNDFFYTKVGDFSIDSRGYLIKTPNLFVCGFKTDSFGRPESNPSKIKLDMNDPENGVLAFVTVESNGMLFAYYGENVRKNPYNIVLAKIPGMYVLDDAGEDLFTLQKDAKPAIIRQPGQSALGVLISGEVSRSLSGEVYDYLQ